MSQPESLRPASPVSPTGPAAPMTATVVPSVESELPDALPQDPAPTRPAEPAAPSASAPRAFLSALSRQGLYRGARYGVLTLWGVMVGLLCVRQQAQQQQLMELESALVARLPAGLTASVEVLHQQVTGLETRLQVLPGELVSRADWQTGIDAQQRDTRAALERVRSQLQQQAEVDATQAQSLRTLQGTLSDLETRVTASASATPAATPTTAPKTAVTSKTTTSPVAASTRQPAPFVLSGIETRGGQTFAVVAPPTGQGLAQLQLVAPGSSVQGWRLVGIEGHQARFLPPNSTQTRVLTPQ
ncbi:hypothetical protein Z042_07465 [Chania multitudinisentens RB-25]|uniref:Uncharacterized protein n=1 Tax=Chania multitudinisentens RB-25 TaxID=1441930 RepID=W0LL21_9GAMM|nr:hypothetical protein [Chania multitudinisentens]AHG22700.1 hypothetical protein Z042_07465 [Chania multitudinisentens RB-25]